MYKTREAVENWLKKMKIKKYVINEDLTVDVKGNVDISYKNLKEIPVNFRIIEGYFNCSHNELISLEGCPQEVNGDFHCNANNLTSLKGCVEKIKDDFHCANNKLTSLEYCPEIIKGNFDCSDNKLTSFKYFPKEINGNSILLYDNNIKEDELLNFNFNIENVKLIYSDFNSVTETKEEFLGRVNYYKNIKKENELLTEISKNNNVIKLNKKL